MEKAKSYLGLVLIATVGGLLALKVYEQMNKPKVTAPATVAANPAT